MKEELEKAALKEKERSMQEAIDPYDLPISSNSEDDIDSDESDESKRKRIAKKKRKAVAPPPPNPDNDTPYYILKGIDPKSKDFQHWMAFSKNQQKQRKKSKRYDSPVPRWTPRGPPPPPPSAGASGNLSANPAAQSESKIFAKSAPPYLVIQDKEPVDTSSENVYESSELDPNFRMARFLELVGAAQIKKAKAEGKDTAGLTTMSKFRMKELDKFQVRPEVFDPSKYMEKHPEAVVPRASELKIIGEQDLKLSRKEAQDPSRKITFTPDQKSKGSLDLPAADLVGGRAPDQKPEWIPTLLVEEWTNSMKKNLAREPNNQLLTVDQFYSAVRQDRGHNIPVDRSIRHSSAIQLFDAPFFGANKAKLPGRYFPFFPPISGCIFLPK
ncbi:hypothetical protein KSP39_PZI022222 [Platanthera zijinensis]|uniref:Uncharacterized protein n=1 Tax=Platanthera zijinensis TaxID=2320716 RepID=A0AAP0FV58_9ASPA